MGTQAVPPAKPGGERQLLCGGVNPSTGKFVEVVVNEWAIFTFGWAVPEHAVPAGSTEVEITLTLIGDSTLAYPST